MRCLLGDEPARPHDRPAAGAEGPRLDVDAVEDRDAGDRVRPGASGAAADRGEGSRRPRAEATGRDDGGLQPRQRRGVQRRDERQIEHRRHRDREVVEAMVVHDVEATCAVAGEVEHEREVRVVLGHPGVRGRVDVTAGQVAGAEGRRLQDGDGQPRVSAGRREEGHLVPAGDELASELVDERLEPAGVGLAHGIAAGPDQAHTHRVTRPDCDRARRGPRPPPGAGRADRRRWRRSGGGSGGRS